MSELREAAERYRDSVYEETDEGFNQLFLDRVNLAEYAVKLTDPTPLSELTEEQWQGLGFEWRYGLLCDFWRWGSAESDWLQWCRDRGLTLKGQAFKNVKTLGQLRHLIVALGGGE